MKKFIVYMFSFMICFGVFAESLELSKLPSKTILPLFNSIDGITIKNIKCDKVSAAFAESNRQFNVGVLYVYTFNGISKGKAETIKIISYEFGGYPTNILISKDNNSKLHKEMIEKLSIGYKTDIEKTATYHNFNIMPTMIWWNMTEPFSGRYKDIGGWAWGAPQLGAYMRALKYKFKDGYMVGLYLAGGRGTNGTALPPRFIVFDRTNLKKFIELLK